MCHGSLDGSVGYQWGKSLVHNPDAVDTVKTELVSDRLDQSDPFVFRFLFGSSHQYELAVA